MAARPLVAAEVWYRVQAVLTAHQTSGEKTQAHDLLQAHYAGAVPLDLLVVMPDDTVDGQPGEPFNILFDPEVQRTALARQRGATESGPQTGNVVGLNNDVMVEPRGLEPLTPCLQSRCATNCAMAPMSERAGASVTQPIRLPVSRDGGLLA